jgi:hypothetical protein
MEFLPLLLLPLLAVWGIVALLFKAGEGIVFLIRTLRDRRRARIERELDAKSAELRQTILTLAQQLDGSAHEVRKALIRESFLASGKVPTDD